MKAVVVTFIPLLSLLIIACNSTVPVRPLTEVERATEVEQARKKLSDLNATQIQETKKLIETRNLLLSMPKDSPPTREISRQLAILQKQAQDLFPQVVKAEVALEKAIARQLDILDKQATDLDSQVFLAELALEKAIEAGANAVVGVDIDYEVLGTGNGMLMVSASGTAVVVA